MISQTVSVEDYLKALYSLGGATEPVRGARIAERLGISRPSISAMLVRLESAGLVSTEKGRGHQLTSAGVKRALKIVRKHRILELYLLKVLKLDWDAVHEEAERLEHALSDRVEQAMADVLGNPAWDPEGLPIPSEDLLLPERALTPLGDERAGVFVIRELRNEQPERIRRFQDRGLLPGATVSLESYDQIDDLYTLRIGKKRVLIGSEGLEGVYVEPVGGKR